MNNVSLIIQQHCVAIDHVTGHGSGVLMQGITEQYSYVLTARHVLQIDKKDESKGIYDKANITLYSAHHESLKVQDIFLHEDFDIAIICIDFIPGIDIYPCEQVLDPATVIQLFGCPNENSSEVNNFLIKFNSIKNSMLEFSPDESNVQPNDIDGYSGGGLFFINENKAYLYGIEKSTTSQAKFVTRINGYHISNFEELIESKNLSHFGVAYLAGFNSIQSNTFSCLDVNNQDSLREVIALLHEIMTERICNSSLTPYLIMNQFKDSLLSYQQEHKKLEEKELWTNILEIIAIQIIINPPVEFNTGWEISYLDELFKSYRLLYSNNMVGWRGLYKALVLPSNFKNLKKTGRILIIGNSHRLPPQPNIEHQFEKTIGDISAGLDRVGIDNARNNRYRKNPIIHWQKLNDTCLAEKQDEYAELNRVLHGEKIVNTLKEDYGQYLLTEDE